MFLSILAVNLFLFQKKNQAKLKNKTQYPEMHKSLVAPFFFSILSIENFKKLYRNV